MQTLTPCVWTEKIDVDLPVLSEKEQLKQFLNEELAPRLGHNIDEEKLFILSKTAQNIMVSANPGSGKSLCLLYKIFLLIRRDTVCEKNIVALTFNKKMSDGLKTRAHQQFDLSDFTSSFSFHSFAYRIVRPKQNIIYNYKNGYAHLSLFIQKIVREYLRSIQFNYDYRQLLKLTRLVTQFISRIKKSGQSATYLKETSDELPFKATALLNIGRLLLLKYQYELKKNDLIDFDDLLAQAIKVIHESRGECEIKISSKDSVRVKDLSHLLIDEVQDLNGQMYNLVDALRQFNPTLHLFCVGDKNQAIYSFLGSRSEYFDRLSSIKDAERCYLKTNYRSQKAVITFANNYMHLEHPMRYLPHNDGGKVCEIRVDDGRDGVIRECLRITEKYPNKSIAILTRTNHIFKRSIHCFLDQLKDMHAKPDKVFNVGISTIHGFKGQESDIVVILMTRGHFPLIHKDGEYFEWFESGVQRIKSEQRLWFVAITRSREGLYIINTS